MNPNNNITDHVTNDTPPLFLPIDDAKLLVLLNEAEERAKADYNNRNIEDKSTSNVKFWKGDQVDNTKLDGRYQMAHIDNVAKQNLEKQIKLAASKMPDIFVAPPDEEQYNLEAARDWQQWIRERIDTNTIKRLIKNGLRHMNLKYIGIIKPRWDYVKNDFTFDLIDPKDMRFSKGSKIIEDGFTIDGVEITFQYIEDPTTVFLAKFKKKKDQLSAEIGIQNKGNMPSTIQYTECHFRWFDDQGRMSEGTAWRYGNVIADSMKEPYYEYDKPELNYFDRPRKPYILMSYLNLGESVYESSTAFEDAIPVNRVINKRRRQITEISDRAVPKMAFSGKALTKEQASNISSSPNEGILMSDTIDDVRKGVFVIPATPPNPILFSDLQGLYQRAADIFSVGGTNSAQNGNTASGVSKQISREDDLVTSDDIVGIVIERVVTEMAAWAAQFARLFYDDDRPPMRTTNEEGDTHFTEMNRQKIETDIQVIVKGSTNDKQTRRSDALQMLTGKVTDPYTLFEDLDVPNPKERTKRLMTFISSQQGNDFTKYLDMIGVDLADNISDEKDAQQDIELLEQGGQPPAGRKPSESYVAVFSTFVNGPDFAALDPQKRANVQQYIAQLQASVQQQSNQDPQGTQPGAIPGQPPAPTDPAQALQGAPGVTPPPVAYQPTIDPSTVFNNPNAGATGGAANSQLKAQFSHFASQIPTAGLRQ